MIPLDGYTEHAELNGEPFAYRPLKRQDRQALAETLSGLPVVLAKRIEAQVIESQIVDRPWGCAVRDFDADLFEQLWTLVLGVGRSTQEIEDERNLHKGVYLLTRWPWMERTTCEQCRDWMWNPMNGSTARQQHDGPKLTRRRGGPLLCDLPAKEFPVLSTTACPRDHWSRPVVLSPKNAMAFRFHQACEAAGSFPDDPIVRRNAGVINDAQRIARADQAADGGPGGGSRPAGELLHPPVGQTRGGRGSPGRIRRGDPVAIG